MIANAGPSYLRNLPVVQACTTLHGAAQDVLAGVMDGNPGIIFEDREEISAAALAQVDKNVLIELQFERPKDIHNGILVLADASALASLFSLKMEEGEQSIDAESLLRLGDIASSVLDALVAELTWLQPTPRAWLANLEPIVPDAAGALRVDLPALLTEEERLYRIDLRITLANQVSCPLQIVIGERAERALLVADAAPVQEEDAAEERSAPSRTAAQSPSATPAPRPASAAAPAPNVAVQAAQFRPLGPEQSTGRNHSIDLIRDVPLKVSVELGRASLTVKEVLALGAGSVVELDRLAGEPADVLVNGRLIARGEVVIVDESFGVRITELLR